MKTSVSRDYSWGFFLSEQELRRTMQTCVEHLEKTSQPFRRMVTARLQDGSVLESQELDEIVATENVGSKAVRMVELSCAEVSEKPNWSVRVRYQDGVHNQRGWNSIQYSVTGASRDWAFLAAADLDERVRRTRQISWSYLASNPLLLPVFLVFLMVFMVVAVSFVPHPRHDVATQLERHYARGEIKDAVQALIFIEREHASIYGEEQAVSRIIWPMLAGAGMPLVLYLLLIFLAPRVLPSYVFYWGDAISIYDKKRSLLRVFWTVLVLGILASIVAGLLLRHL